MNRLLGLGFFLLLVMSAVVIVATSMDLPPVVGSHFAADGRPNGWQSVETYRVLMLAFGVLAPCVVVAALAWLPRVYPGFCRLPHEDYWLAPQRRDATYRALATFGFATGILAVVFALGIHLAVVAANATSPPRLSSAAFVLLLATFAVALVVLVVAYHRRFRTVR